MLTTDPSSRNQDQNQEQLSISNRTAHSKDYPFLKEFSELLVDLSTKDLKELMSHQQLLFAKSLWEAENYGGSKEKCIKRLTEIYGSKWREVTTIKEHMANIRDYYIVVLKIDHLKQWDEYKKSATISSENILE
jgi:hypothetical protein